MPALKKPRKLDTLLIMTHCMTGGGSERVIAQLANAFAADGVAVTIVTECHRGCFYPLDSRVRLLPLIATERARTRDIPRCYFRLRRVVKRERPSVVLAMPEKVNVWTVLALLGTGVPVVVSERNDPARHPESRIKRFLRTLAYPRAAGFIFQTEAQRDYFPPSIRCRGTVLDNPLVCAALPRLARWPREKTVVAAGRLEPQKNLPLLICAFARFHARHPDYRLVLFGEGAQREALTALAASLLPAGAYTFAGQTKQLAQAMAQSALLVLSSDFEGMPNVLMEAMAMGLCCIATDCPCGGPASLITPGETGLLIPVGDEDALFAALCRAAEEEGLAERLGTAAVSLRERLDAPHVIEKWRKYLEGVSR